MNYDTEPFTRFEPITPLNTEFLHHKYKYVIFQMKDKVNCNKNKNFEI